MDTKIENMNDVDAWSISDVMSIYEADVRRMPVDDVKWRTSEDILKNSSMNSQCRTAQDSTALLHSTML